MNEFNPYTPPKSDVENFKLPNGICRNEKNVILPHSLLHLPLFCIKCGKATEKSDLELAAYKNQTRLVITLFVSTIIIFLQIKFDKTLATYLPDAIVTIAAGLSMLTYLF